MSWTYWKFKKEDRHTIVPVKGNAYPPAGECFPGLDMDDHKVKVCRRQPGSDPFYGILAVDGDDWTDSADIVAWAPLATTEAPDMEAVKAAGGFSPPTGSREHWAGVLKYWRYSRCKTKKEQARRKRWMDFAKDQMAVAQPAHTSTHTRNG